MKTIRARTAAAIALAVAILPRVASAQEFSAPAAIVDGDPLTWQLRDLPPGTEVEVTLERTSNGSRETAKAVYRVNSDGQIDPCRDAPLSGTYSGVDCSGLSWSVSSAPTGSVEMPSIALVATASGQTLARADVSLSEPRVREEAIAAFPGAKLFLPKDAKRPPVVILLGGSEGGDWFGNIMGPKLAARGFAAISLPYYTSGWSGAGIAGLPTAFRDIPIDRLAMVRDWLTARGDLDAGRIALHGASKGGEFALAAATRFDWINAVVAIVPSDVIWEGWGDGAPAGTTSSFSWEGKSLPFVPYEGMDAVLAGFAQGRGGSFLAPHVEGRRRHPEAVALARIKVETIAAPVFLAGGDRDTTWPSGQMVRSIAERRAENCLITEAHTFADAGHALSGTGWNATGAGRSETAQADAAAQRKVWPEVIQFLQKYLSTGKTNDYSFRPCSTK